MFTKSPLNSAPCPYHRVTGTHRQRAWIKRCLPLCCAGLLLWFPALHSANTPSLDIHGVDKVARKNIRAFVDLSAYRCDEPDWRLAYLKNNSRKKARKALEALGYYHAEITTTLQHQNQCWKLMLDASTGPRTVIHKVDLQVIGGMASLPGFKALQRSMMELQGQPLKHSLYERARSDLEDLASRYGFFSGKFTLHRLAIDRRKNQAEILLHYDSGPRYRFGETTINSKKLGPRLLNQFKIVHRGDYYDSSLLTRQQQILYDSHYFSSVEVIPLRKVNKQHLVPVTIHVEERKRHAYTLGMGYSTDTGFRISLGFENRWLNRRGHHYNFSGKWSQISQDTTFNYSIPLGDHGTHKLDLSFGRKAEKTETSRSQTTQYGLIFSRTLPHDWKQTLSLRSFREIFETVDNDESTNLLLGGYSLSKTVLDDPLYPRSGWRLSVQAKAANQSWYSDLDMLQLSGQSKLIRPWKKFRILARGSAGTTATSSFSKLPASLRFYAGGDSSVRGFRYKSLGPLNADGEVNGGRNLLTGSLELEYPFKQQWGIAAFIDAGNAFDSFSDYEMHKSVGIGARYHSIIGPIRIDIAWPLAPDNGYRLHLSMGPDL